MRWDMDFPPRYEPRSTLHVLMTKYGDGRMGLQVIFATIVLLAAGSAHDVELGFNPALGEHGEAIAFSATPSAQVDLLPTLERGDLVLSQSRRSSRSRDGSGRRQILG